MATELLLSLSELIRPRPKARRIPQSDLFSLQRGSSDVTDRRKYECTWYADFDPDRDLPNVIRLVDGDFDRLFADVSTYYSDYAPITNTVHVVDEKFSEWSRGGLGDAAYSATFTENERRLWVALCLAEGVATAYSAGGQEDDASYSHCRRGMSYAIARGHVLYPRWPLDDIASRWLRLREISRMESSEAITAAVLWISMAVLGRSGRNAAFGAAENFRKAIIDLYGGLTTSADFTDLIAGLYPGIAGLVGELNGEFDGRIPALERVVSYIKQMSQGKEVDAVVIAFFANQVLPGSFAYTKLLSRHTDAYPSLLIWYGFITAIGEEFDWRGVSFGTGSKLWRDISRRGELCSRPSCDIALEELLVLSRLELRAKVLKPTHQRSMSVSLLPCLEILTRFPSDERLQPGQGGLQGGEGEALRSAIAARDEKLLSLLKQAEELVAGGRVRQSVGRAGGEQKARRSRAAEKKG